MSKHSVLSPSAADRWATCTGSVQLISMLDLPEDRSSRWAAEGTFAHLMRAKMLAGEDVIGQSASVDGFHFVCDAEMAALLEPGVRALLSLREPVLVEQRVSIQKYAPGCFGTADAVGRQGRTLIVNDLKYGMGKAVSAYRNRQLMLYALGALSLYDGGAKAFDEVRLEIDQPRVASGGSVWACSMAELLEFGDEIRVAAGKALGTEGELVPSDDACRWCPAKAQCPALSSKALELIDNVSPWAPPKSVSPELRSRILSARGQIDTWLDSLAEEAMRDALAGAVVPGMKLVEGRRGARQWIDATAAAAELESRLGNEAWVRKLVSPAQAGALLGRKAALPDTVQAPGALVLVADTDPRPAAVQAGAFEELVTPPSTTAWD